MIEEEEKDNEESAEIFVMEDGCKIVAYKKDRIEIECSDGKKIVLGKQELAFLDGVLDL